MIDMNIFKLIGEYILILDVGLGKCFRREIRNGYFIF